MDTQLTAFVRVELYPLGKNLIADIAEIHIKKISKNLNVDSCVIKFLPLNSYFSKSSSNKGKIRWRCLALENSLNHLRHELTGVSLLICYDELTKSFLKDAIDWPIETMIPSESSLPSKNKKVTLDLSSDTSESRDTVDE